MLLWLASLQSQGYSLLLSGEIPSCIEVVPVEFTSMLVTICILKYQYDLESLANSASPNIKTSYLRQAGFKLVDGT